VIPFLAMAAIAAGGVTVSGELSPQTLSWPRANRMSLTLRLQAGSAPQPLRIVVSTPSLRSVAMGVERREGSPIAWSGDGRETGLSDFRLESVVSGLPACSPRGGAAHGFELAGRTYRAALAPGASAQLSLDFALDTSTAPWPSTDLRPDVTVNGQAVALAAPRLTGPTGTAVTLDSTPRLSPSPLKRLRAVRLGRTITMRGRTQPPLRHRRLRLRVTRGRVPEATLEPIRTDGHGRFTHRWRPAVAGHYELWVLTPAVGRHIRADYACPAAVDVRSR
jgi:hypothetical protein